MFGAALAWIEVEPVETPVTATVALVAPDAKVTLDGTVATPVLSELKFMVTPLAGAGAERISETNFQSRPRNGERRREVSQRRAYLHRLAGRGQSERRCRDGRRAKIDARNFRSPGWDFRARGHLDAGRAYRQLAGIAAGQRNNEPSRTARGLPGSRKMSKSGPQLTVTLAVGESRRIHYVYRRASGCKGGSRRGCRDGCAAWAFPGVTVAVALVEPVWKWLPSAASWRRWVLLLDRLMAWPFTPAGADSDTVKVAVALFPMLRGFGESVICTLEMFTVAVRRVKPALVADAVMVALPRATGVTVAIALLES